MNIQDATKLTIAVLSKDPTLPLLWVGSSGVGKTTCAEEVAKALGKTFLFIPVRAEDPLGLNLPDKSYSRLRFVPHAHFQKAIDEPCLLYIDELNRANQLTRAAVMELLTDTAARTCGGHKLHPDTSILLTQNDESDCYDVFESDAALKTRTIPIPIHVDPDLSLQFAQQRQYSRMINWIQEHGQKMKRELSWKVPYDPRFLCLLERFFNAAGPKLKKDCQAVASFSLGPTAKAFISTTKEVPVVPTSLKQPSLEDLYGKICKKPRK